LKDGIRRQARESPPTPRTRVPSRQPGRSAMIADRRALRLRGSSSIAAARMLRYLNNSGDDATAGDAFGSALARGPSHQILGSVRPAAPGTAAAILYA
jgi:hypothetical protein